MSKTNCQLFIPPDRCAYYHPVGDDFAPCTDPQNCTDKEEPLSAAAVRKESK